MQPGSIALLENAEIVAQLDLANGIRTTCSLIPGIQDQLAKLGWQPTDLDLVAVSHGPGSFTGLRVGITVAKALAYALGAEVMGISTLDVIARQAEVSSPDLATRTSEIDTSEVGVQSLWSLIDAQRQQVFVARYEPVASAPWRRAESTCVLGVDTWLAKIAPGDVISGPPVEKLRSRVRPDVAIIAAVNGVPRAATVGRLAAEAFHRGERGDLWALVPQYHRLSAAEEKRAAASP